MKSEGSQHIYHLHTDKLKKTEFGNRAMTELGNIQGLEIDDTVNYILIPCKDKDNKTTSWHIHRLTKEHDIDWKKDIEEEFDLPIKKL